MSEQRGSAVEAAAADAGDAADTWLREILERGERTSSTPAPQQPETM
jgi:hypothetical protein